MNEEENIRLHIIGINGTNVKVLSGEVLSITSVKEKIQEGQKFSVVDPESVLVADVIVADDGTLKMKLPDGSEKTLDKLPTFT